MPEQVPPGTYSGIYKDIVMPEQHATWQINTKILSICRVRRHIVAAARLQLVKVGEGIWTKLSETSAYETQKIWLIFESDLSHIS